DLRVTGEADHRGRRDGHSVVEPVEVGSHDVAELNEEPLAGRCVGGQSDPWREAAPRLGPARPDFRWPRLPDPEDARRGQVGGKMGEVERLGRKGRGWSGSMTSGVRAGEMFDSK